MTLKSDYCISNCLRHSKSVTVHSVTSFLIKSTSSSHSKSSMTENIAKVSAYAFIRIIERFSNEVIVMWSHDFEKLSASSEDSTHEQKKFTVDLIVVTAKDYEKFFYKLRKKSLIMKQLRSRVPQLYYK